MRSDEIEYYVSDAFGCSVLLLYFIIMMPYLYYNQEDFNICQQSTSLYIHMKILKQQQSMWNILEIGCVQLAKST